MNNLFSNLGYNEKLLFKIAQIAFEEAWNRTTVLYPSTEYETDMHKHNNKLNSVRRNELVLDLHGCLDANV